MGRTPCCSVEHIKKGAWTAEEDQKLIAYIQEHGEGGWRTLPRKAGLQRCGKSCRLRWANYLRPDIKRGEFSAEEDVKIIQLQSTLGNRWSAIAKQLLGRTDNEIKNYWNTHLKKRISKISTGTSGRNGPPIINNSIVAPLHAVSSKNSESTNVVVDDDNICNNDDVAVNNPTSDVNVPHHDFNVGDADKRSSGSTTTSSSSSSSTSKFLNKLAGTKLMPSSTWFDAIKDAQHPTEIDVKADDDNNQDFVSRPVSRFSAKLLNKVASRLSTPMICRDMVKSIVLSDPNNGARNNGSVGATNSMSNSSEESEMRMSKSTSTASITEATTTVNSIENTDKCLESAMAGDFFDLDDFLRDWQGMETSEFEGGVVPSTSMADNYSVESPASSPINLINYCEPSSTPDPCHDLPEIYWTF